MNDDFDELEREISRLPMPSVSQALDDRVWSSLQHIRQSNKATTVAPLSSVSWRWAAFQTLAAIILCIVSFVAGRYSSAVGNVQADHAQQPLDHRQIAVVQASIEPSAQSSFQRLIGGVSAQETIWGTSVVWDGSVKEEL